MLRPDWDTTWLAVAHTIGERSRCGSRQVGAVIVSDTNRPVAVGYNGPPAGAVLEDDLGCEAFCPRRQSGDQSLDYSNCVSVHAEANALMFADRRDYEGGTIYITSAICWDCGKMVANSGIEVVVMEYDPVADAHRDPQRTIRFLERCGISVIALER